MQNKDRVKASWEQGKNTAIKFVESLVEDMMEGYREPTRVKTRRGDPIGLSCKKKRAALSMILYNPPYGLGLKEIAKIVDVPPGVLRVWRTEAAFKKEVIDACDSVAEMISNTVHRHLFMKEIQSVKDARIKDGPNVFRLLKGGGKTIFKVLKSERGTPLVETFIRLAPRKQIEVVEIDDSPEGLKQPFLKINRTSHGREIDQADTPSFIVKLLPFFHPFISQRVTEFIEKHVQSPFKGYRNLAFILSWVLDVRDDKSFKQYKARPEVKQLRKKVVGNLIDFISDPETRKAYGPERIQEVIKALKTFIFEELDL